MTEEFNVPLHIGYKLVCRGQLLSHSGAGGVHHVLENSSVFSVRGVEPETSRIKSLNFLILN